MASPTKLIPRHNDGQLSMAWELEKTKKKEESCPDTLTIMEDQTTEWENDTINKWTKKALRLVRKGVNNKFLEGVMLHKMTVDHLVRGHEDSPDNPSLTARQYMRKNKGLTIDEACAKIISQAWYYSLESFLREKPHQGTCETEKKVLYYGKPATEEGSADQHLARVDPRKRSLSVGASRYERVTEFEEHRSQRKQSSKVRSYSGVRVNTRPGVISLK
ncbi:uncharacterized protein J4E79_005018 [Alternaria viburni]|uniref:uncharacterized protein n=1 Tax=Alternaria viburni TaxID=566460 RepID=UPI0020C37F4B|nr:uncharacterized protein J4E79_005018 [Alternaria viburni]KAI4661206.1 hypothetical protein J4E79_005018 [Alternaria viburni]